MADTTDLLLDFAFDTRNRSSSVVRGRIFSSEEEMYASASVSQQRDEFPVSIPPELFDPTASLKKEKLRHRRPDPGFAQSMGKVLWESMPPDVRTAVAGATAARPLRLKICSDHQALLEVPWEWMHDGQQPVALHENVRMVRSVPVRYTTPPAPVNKPVRVLIIVSNPKDERLLDTFTEVEAASRRLHQPDYEHHLLEQPTVDAWRDTLESFRPDIIHYIGHAGVSGGEGNVILHDRDISHWIGSRMLSSLVPSTVRLLCLSTCFTTRNYQIAGLERVAEASPSCPLPSAIVNRYPLVGASVEAFWTEFYDALMRFGGDVGEAFHAGRRRTAMATQTADWSSFALVLRDNTGQPMEIQDDAPAVLAMAEAAEISDLAARAIRAQFRTDVRNVLAEQMKSLGSDAPKDLLVHLNALDSFTKLMGEE